MTEQQVEDVVNFIRTIQVPQMDAVAEFDGTIRPNQANRLANAEATVEGALLSQRQVVANIRRAPERGDDLNAFAERARSLLDGASEGIDTDGDGLSDAAETALVELGEELVDYLTFVDDVTLDPENAQTIEGTDDLTTASRLVSQLTEAVESGAHPGLAPQAEAARQAFDEGVVDPDVGLSPAAAAALVEIVEDLDGFDPPSGQLDLSAATDLVESLEAEAEAEGASEDLVQAATDAREVLEGGQDPDGDGLSTAAENRISEQVSAANGTPFVPAEAVVPALDPANEATSGEPDATVASRVVSGYESLALSTNVTANNIDGILPPAEAGVAFLEESLEAKRWEIDFEGVAEAAFDGDVDAAERAVLLFNGFCARCHTAGFAAGVAYTLEAGAGGFGPALWDGRPVVQFGEAADAPQDDLLVQFIINGSEAETPYGLNGFGSGRMPAFGQILSEDDIVLLARYLRGGDLTGLENEDVDPDA